MAPKSLMVIQYVHDMPAAVSFYRDGVGLELVSKSAGWSMFRCGDALVGLHGIYGSVTERPVPYAGLNLEVDDLDPAIERAVAHGARLVEVREPEPGIPVRLGVLIDPNGNGLELRQQMGA
ncbi:VOC family protein [Phenylobacterium sp.]|uniref:VOC family protein n=1 Tax=Phenylobacterium sp. TaxID=1871053 RepID=UPI002E35CB3A|nr:VOC family protein [Phenylobacterium sp.]HEX2559784.1 VOC family protein [Phenylobacterium sp.]